MLNLERAIFFVGIGQLLVLIASALVPMQLNWKQTLAEVPKLVRQLFWVYGFYVVLAIVSMGLICIFNAEQLAGGSGLARSFCGYVAAFWGIRLSLQAFLDAKPHLTKTYLIVGYHLLSILFTLFTAVMLWAVFHR